MFDRRLFRRRLSWALTGLVFFALPMLLLVIAVERQWSRTERASFEQARQRHDRLLLMLQQREDPERYLAEVFQALQTMSWGPKATVSREIVLRGGLMNLRRRFPGLLSVVVVDANGDLIDSLTDRPVSRVLSRRLFQILLKEKRGELKSEEARGAWPLLQSFVGPQAKMMDVISSRINLRQANHTPSNAFFYPALDEGGALFFHVHRPLEWHAIALKDQLGLIRAKHPGSKWKAGLLPHGFQCPGNPDLQQALDAFEKTLQSFQQSGDRWYSIVRLRDGSRLWVSLPRTVVVDYSLWRVRLAVLATILFGVLLSLAARMEFGVHRTTLPIRRRLILLFGFSAGLPLAVLWITGWDYLDHLERVRTREAYEETERQLWAFDSRFRQMRHYLERRLNQGASVCSFQTHGQWLQSLEKLKTLAAEFDTTDLMLFDHRGKLQWRYPERFHVQKEAASRLLGEVTGRLCALLNREDGEEKSLTTGLLLDTLQEFGGGLDIISHLAGTLGTITEFSSGAEKAWVFMARFYDRPGHISHMVLFNWRKTDLEKFYLERSLLSAEREWPGLSMLAFNAQGTVRKFTPSFHPMIVSALPIMREQRQRDATVFSTIRYGGEPWLACALKPKELNDYHLCGAHSFAPIQVELERWRRFYWLFTIVLSAMTLILGVMLSRRFLEPVRELSLAVSAIERRDFKHRLRNFDPDELGRLAETFNRVMEGLSDLEVGRIVQESLFPKEEMRIGSYRIFGRSRSATAVGGDYFDLRELSGGRALILIGDVTGHGVPAALIMALAKGVAEALCERDTPLEEMLRVLNRIIFKTMRRKRLMTCFLAVLDSEGHEMKIANAGHCYPFLLRSGESPRSIVDKQFPLGARADSVYVSVAVSMQAGDRVMFFTDGLSETSTTEGLIGVKALQEAALCLFDADLPGSCERIFTWVETQDCLPEQQDDMTVVLLMRDND